MEAITPQVKLTYGGRDITADLSPYLMRVAYTDRLDGSADSLDVALAETDAIKSRWLSDWYPDKGMEMKLEYGYAGQPLVSAGSFDVDEIEIESPPLSIRIRALATGISRAVRTRIGKAYENTTLAKILDEIAKRIGAKRKGKVADIPIDRATQYQETDWAFAVRLAREYGYALKLTDNNKTLAVMKLGEDAAPVRTLAPGDLTRYTYRDRITEVPARSEARHHDPATGQLVIYRIEKGVAVPDGTTTAADTRKRHVRAKTPEQAKAIAEAEQARHEIDKTSLEVQLPGDPLLVAGATVDVAGLARLDGRYLIIEARHEISRDAGYATTVSLKRIQEKTP
ncbi:phage late control D family protein [Pelomicrobium methylotrophicum]|uniref:Phage protein D n=1 Tax=Pelomicrobium methylotrophicum TaxID=2602750 RepID=A0A5C7ELF6_9PROT|nr:contractile injection system protein, VgrG/Pvc8 family [Pelomicrobium methylotrophicum]TXF11936.1 phage protein D [Pelomicrobium methylotrophicum]